MSTRDLPPDWACQDQESLDLDVAAAAAEQASPTPPQAPPYGAAVGSAAGGLWTAQECAEHCGIALKTWHGYVAKKLPPAPVQRVGRTPLWSPAEVRAWHAQRPGSGRWGSRSASA